MTLLCISSAISVWPRPLIHWCGVYTVPLTAFVLYCVHMVSFFDILHTEVIQLSVGLMVRDQTLTQPYC